MYASSGTLLRSIRASRTDCSREFTYTMPLSPLAARRRDVGVLVRAPAGILEQEVLASRRISDDVGDAECRHDLLGDVVIGCRRHSEDLGVAEDFEDLAEAPVGGTMARSGLGDVMGLVDDDEAHALGSSEASADGARGTPVW